MASSKQTFAYLVLALCLTSLAELASAGQGCPFDDSSCQEYCSQQGCNMGYCGHFAWTQCICRKCGDEWNTYDKVKSNPNAAVNQTELDSLKMTNPIFLASANNTKAASEAASSTTTTSTTTTTAKAASEAPATTLATLILPDLSDSKLGELNDMPEENSDKFLDYIAKNHERIVEQQSATGRPELAGGSTTPSPKAAAQEAELEQQQQEQPLARLLMNRGAGGDDVPTIVLS